MPYSKIPRQRCFSLSDFHDFEICPFKFFVRHHLEKKYEFDEATESRALGSLLDLSIKKFHQTKAYSQPAEYLAHLVKAADLEMREKVAKSGLNSFYGGQIKFLTPDLLKKATNIFTKYYLGVGGKFNRSISSTSFWERVLGEDTDSVKLWGGPDIVELAPDGIPQVVDFKYFENGNGARNLDMDLMPKIYVLLCAAQLLKLGYTRARFLVRFWQEPENTDYYEEFDLTSQVRGLDSFFQEKIIKILGATSLSFCEKDYCQVCKSDKRTEWIFSLQQSGYIEADTDISLPTAQEILENPDHPLPF